MNDIFEFLRSEEEGEPDRSWRAVVRNYRPRFLKRTITTHNDQLPAVLKFPLGFSWRRVRGLDWCPFCMSISPMSAMMLIWSAKAWDPQSSMREMQALVDRGEMDSEKHSIWEAYHPVEGFVYGSYVFNDVGEPAVLVLHLPKHESTAFHLSHLYDLPPVILPALLAHMNRIAPTLHWSIAHNGIVQWSAAVPAAAAVLVDDDDDQDDPQDPPQP